MRKKAKYGMYSNDPILSIFIIISVPVSAQFQDQYRIFQYTVLFFSGSFLKALVDLTNTSLPSNTSSPMLTTGNPGVSPLENLAAKSKSSPNFCFSNSALWQLYSMNWSVRPDCRFRIAVESNMSDRF